MEYVKNFKKFQNDKTNSVVNEGILKNIFNFAKDILKIGKIKKVLKKYQEEYPKLMEDQYKTELKIKIAEKGDSKEVIDDLKKELENIKEEEELLKEELDNEIEEAIKKRPDIKYKIKKLHLEARRSMLKKSTEILKKIKEDEEFSSIIDSIDEKIKKHKKHTNTINKKIKEIEKEQKNSNDNKEKEGSNIKIGDIFKYKNNDGVDATRMVVDINKKEGKINDVKYVILKTENDENPISTEKLKQADRKTMGDINNPGEKIREEKNLEKYKEHIKIAKEAAKQKDENLGKENKK